MRQVQMPPHRKNGSDTYRRAVLIVAIIYAVVILLALGAVTFIVFYLPGVNP